jgi:four helix bundle protein
MGSKVKGADVAPPISETGPAVGSLAPRRVLELLRANLFGPHFQSAVVSSVRIARAGRRRDDFRSSTHLQSAAADKQGMSAALPAFDYQRLDAFKVARETLRLGDALARRLPRGYATLQDQLRRALLSAYLGIAEASSRQGADRLCRFRCARGEACEAAAALEGVLVLNLAPEAEILTLLALLERLCAMLTRLAHMGGPSGPAQIGQRERSRER